MQRRNYGIDYLRLLAMFGIVTLHTLSRSQLLISTNHNQFTIAWIIEILFYFSVNCFALITGFVSYSEKEKPLNLKNYLNIWAEVVFYGVLSVVCIRLFFQNISFRENIVKVLFPLITGRYWYFSAFTGTFLLSKAINKSVRYTHDSILNRAVVTIIMFFSLFECISFILNKEYTISSLLNGYSFVWIFLMYYVGACLRKTKIYLKINVKKSLIILLSLSVFNIVWFLYMGTILNRIIPVAHNWSRLFIYYTSPTVVLISILLVCVFARIQCTKSLENIAKFIAPRTFSIYLINSQYLIVKNIFSAEKMAFLLDKTGLLLILYVIFITIVFIMVCLVVDSLRIQTFKMFKVDDYTEKVARQLSLLVNDLFKLGQQLLR